MSPTAHVVYGGAAAAVIYPAAGVYSLVFWAASFLIDLDHYIDYVYHNGFTDLSFRKMFDYHNALDAFWFNPAFLNIEMFHTVEVMLPLYMLTAWTGSTLLLAVFFGFVFHIALDMVYLHGNGIFFMRAYSIAEYFMRMRAIKEKGYLPEEIFDAVFSRLLKNPHARSGCSKSSRPMLLAWVPRCVEERGMRRILSIRRSDERR